MNRDHHELQTETHSPLSDLGKELSETELCFLNCTYYRAT